MALPRTKQIRDLLEAQLNREVLLQPSEPPDTTERGLSYAVYVDTHLATEAAYIGAAVRLVPVGVASATVHEAALPPVLAERFEEVLRGWAPLFASPGDEAVRLYDAALAGRRPPSDVVALAAAPGRRLDLAVSVRAYGEGRLSVVMGR